MKKNIGWGPETVDEAIHHFLPMIKQIANRYKRHFEFDDAFQAAAEGFVRAFKKFDENRGVKFTSIVHPYMKGYVMGLRRTGGSVHYSEEVMILASKIYRDNMVDADREEVKQAYGCTDFMVDAVRSYFIGKISLNAPLVSGTTGEHVDFLPSPDDDYTGLYVEEFINTLDAREQHLMDRRYDNFSFADIGKENNRSREGVRLWMLDVRDKWKAYTGGEPIV